MTTGSDASHTKIINGVPTVPQFAAFRLLRVKDMVTGEVINETWVRSEQHGGPKSDDVQRLVGFTFDVAAAEADMPFLDRLAEQLLQNFGQATDSAWRSLPESFEIPGFPERRAVAPTTTPLQNPS